ncbi:Ig domain-containing protein [Peribacillus frigoritolerans]|uniref:Ig domain-containing protein n=1 Tax=Peribacillus frigoritolerans TaxID=450367 RepID=UPI00339755D7
MKKRNVKSIQGRQVVPNPIGPECIRVTKVYDWVVLTNRDRNKVQIPEECFAAIEDARHEGNTITATCSEVAGTRSCDFIGATPANIPSVPGAQIVSLAFHVHIRVIFFCNGAPLPGCNFVVPVSFMDEVILCFPEGTEINCNIFDVQCTVVLNQMLGDMVVLDVTMCKDVQVEAEVKLEVEAKFCGPRPVIPIEEEGFVCPTPRFPQQCPTFFPTLNCNCQGAAEFNGEASILVFEDGLGGPTTGNLDLTALVCDQCTLTNSRIQVSYIDTLGPTPIGTPDADIDQSFTFTANDILQPSCTTDPATGLVTGLTATGTGVITPAGGAPENATFTLTLTDPDPLGDTASLTISSPSLTVTIALTLAANPGLEVEVGDCDRFPV